MKILVQTVFVLSILFISSCNLKDEYDVPSWDISASAPIATSSVGFTNLLSDKTLSIDTLGDNSMIFVFQQDLVDYDFDDLVPSSSMSLTRTETLEDFDVDDVSFSKTISFGQIVSPLSIEDGINVPIQLPAPPFFYNPFDVSRTDVFDKIFSFDANDEFQQISFADGLLEFKFTNNFDIDLTNILVEIYSVDENQSTYPLNSYNISSLNAGEEFFNQFVLNGKFMTGNIRVSITNIDIPAQISEFTVNYEDALVASILMKDIQLQNATVLLPSQDILNEDTTFNFDFDGAELNSISLSDGEIVLDINSTLNTNLKFEYRISGATKDGQEFYVYREIPPLGSINETIALIGYECDLTGADGSQFNNLLLESRAWIDSTGVPVSISLNDGVSSLVTISNITPEYAKGYLGQDSITESGESSFIDFRSFGGDIDFEFVDVKMVTENFLGASANLHVLKIESFNGSSSIELESPLISSPFNIAAGVESGDSENPVIGTITEIVFDETNSNIDKIVESKPDKIAYEFEMILNGENDNNQYNDFIYLDYGVKSELQIEIPVSMKATNMILKDTVNVSLSVPDLIEDGSFTVLVNNGFPFSADIKLELMNSEGLILETLESQSLIQASEVNPKGITSRSTMSKINFPFENLSSVLNKTKMIGIEITLNTEPSDQFIKLYTDYSIDMTVIGNFEKLISQSITN